MILTCALLLLSRKILDEIDEHGIKIYHLPDAESDEDEDFKEQTRILKVSFPLPAQLFICKKTITQGFFVYFNHRNGNLLIQAV